MILQAPFATSHELDYPVSQTLIDNHEGIRFVGIWTKLHQNPHTRLVRNEPTTPPQIIPKSPIVPLLRKHVATIATIDLLPLQDETKLERLLILCRALKFKKFCYPIEPFSRIVTRVFWKFQPCHFGRKNLTATIKLF